MPTNLRLENQLDSTQNSSYFSLSISSLRLYRELQLRGPNLQFNIQPRLAIFSKWSTIHITGFLGEVFESAAAEKSPEVTRWITQRITWSWSSRNILLSMILRIHNIAVDDETELPSVLADNPFFPVAATKYRYVAC